jgi:outer membrane protein
VLAPRPARAGERVLTLDEAYALALKAHESIAIAVEDVAQAEGTLGKATSLLLPRVTADAGYTVYSGEKGIGTYVLQPEDAASVVLKISQPIYSGGKEWAARRQAAHSLESAREGLEAAREAVILSTASAYYGVLKAGREAGIKDAALKRAVERSKVAAARFRVGDATKAAALRAEAEAAGAEAELIKASKALVDANDALRRLVMTDEDIAVAAPEPSAQGLPTADALVARAAESRRDLRQSALSVKSAEAGVSYAMGGFMPTFKAEGSYTWRDQNPETTFFLEDSVSASLIMSLPLFEGGLTWSDVKEARGKLREAELKRQWLRRDIEVEVRKAYNGVEALRSAIEAYAKQREFAAENYRMVFEQFKNGLATTVDVLDADSVLVSSESSLMNATYDLEVSILKLKYSAGVLMESIAGRPAPQGGSLK